jgi:hypothetical protein
VQRDKLLRADIGALIRVRLFLQIQVTDGAILSMLLSKGLRLEQ